MNKELVAKLTGPVAWWMITALTTGAIGSFWLTVEISRRPTADEVRRRLDLIHEQVERNTDKLMRLMKENANEGKESGPRGATDQGEGDAPGVL